MTDAMAMTPKEIIHELNKYVIGQDKAKKAVAIALRNRWRRMRVSDELREEISPKNILMVGSTGVGKTEIARRLAALTGAPFIKVEATKFTEVGYVGRDVETIIRDLVDSAVHLAQEEAYRHVSAQAEEEAEEKIIDALIERQSLGKKKESKEISTKPRAKNRQWFRKKIREGALDNDRIELDLPVQLGLGVEIVSPPGMEEMTDQLQSLFQSLGSDRKKKREMKISEARRLLAEDEASKLINEEEIRAQALHSAEENGIVFIDEIDKVIKHEHGVSGEVSREGVQRDLLPLIEGTTVNTKHGMIRTQHILFIASGSFVQTKPSDMISELQGRLPIRVELKDLTVGDFEKILTEPKASLVEQCQALLATEGVELSFSKMAIRRMAEISFRLNETTENIGARRLYMIIEKAIEEISFNAPEMSGAKQIIDQEAIDATFAKLLKSQDLTRWVL
jgi:ATP-dependent HslUV protease ATP-binding subunit HslU